MRIVFIDPGFGQRSWATFGQSHWTSIIHQGLCSLSACCKEAGYSDVHLLDIRTMRNTEEFKNRFMELDPDVAAFSMRSCDTAMDYRLASLVKSVDPKCITVVGGVHVSIDPEFAKTQQVYDYIIAGEGEISFVNLLQALGSGDSYPRFSWGEHPDLDQLPFIDRELYPYGTTIALPNYEGVFKSPMVTMICSRGCAYNCSFCAPHSRNHFGKGVRFRSVRNVIAELELLRDRYKFNCVKFYDYTFTQSREWAEDFCDSYAHIGKPFWIQSRADLVARQPDLVTKLKKVGLEMIGIGFESGSDKTLRFLRKGATRKINLAAAEIVRSNDVLLSASFMIGIPEETDEDVEATVSLARQVRPNFTSVAFFTPIPGNDLYTYCKERDLILNEDPEMYVEFSPEIPKIKGKDYDYLRGAAERIMGERFGGKVIGKIIRYLYVKTKYNYKLRSILVFCYSKWVSSSMYRGIDRLKRYSLSK